MCRTRYSRLVVTTAVTASLLLLSASAATSTKSGDKTKLPALRWDEQRPGCTISRGDDGKYRYGLWSDDFGITVAVDSQELAKVRHRRSQFFAVLLDIRYRGKAAVNFDISDISLEFVNHFQVIQTALDPDGFSQKLQSDADTLNDATARELAKHPEKRAEKEAYVRAFLKDSADLQEFVAKDSLRPTRLDLGNAEISGWVLFS